MRRRTEALAKLKAMNKALRAGKKVDMKKYRAVVAQVIKQSMELNAETRKSNNVWIQTHPNVRRIAEAEAIARKIQAVAARARKVLEEAQRRKTTHG